MRLLFKSLHSVGLFGFALFLLLVALQAAACGDPDPAASTDSGSAPPADQKIRDAGDLGVGDLGATHKDMLTPGYYTSGAGSSLRVAVDDFLTAARATPLIHPLADKAGKLPAYKVSNMGKFGATKGSGGGAQHHPATDMYVGNKETSVTVYAAHDGVVSTVKDAAKYRHYVAITQSITGSGGKVLGKLVTLYAHVDLDKDEAAGMKMNGKQVKAGDAIAKNLYAGTVGGPHLHFEIRYYRAADKGTESFYGMKMGNASFTQASSGGWTLGYWDPNVGYGYGHPASHGLDVQ
jgi:murein DD-endopeptidase MepM/ murein hydrolase activator NlpD